LLSRAERFFPAEDIHNILTGKYGSDFRQIIYDAFSAGGEAYGEFGTTLAVIAALDNVLDEDGRLKSGWERDLSAMLASDQAAQSRCEGALLVMLLAFEARATGGLRIPDASGITHQQMHRLEKLVRPELDSDMPAARYAAAWAYVWLGYHGLDARRFVQKVLPKLYREWKRAPDAIARGMFGWAVGCLPLLSSDTKVLGRPTESDFEFLEREARARQRKRIPREDRRPAALVASYYFGGPWHGDDLERRVAALREGLSTRERLLRRMK
jgi:hypothetical protein